MGVMTAGAEEVSPLATEKIPSPFPMNARFPGSEDVAVTFTAEPVTFCKIDEMAVIKPEFIPIFWIVAIETPPEILPMVKHDVGMLFFEFPPLRVHLHRGMTVTTGEDTLCQRRRRDGEFLFSSHHWGGQANSKQKDKTERNAYF